MIGLFLSTSEVLLGGPQTPGPLGLRQRWRARRLCGLCLLDVLDELDKRGVRLREHLLYAHVALGQEVPYGLEGGLHGFLELRVVLLDRLLRLRVSLGDNGLHLRDLKFLCVEASTKQLLGDVPVVQHISVVIHDPLEL